MNKVILCGNVGKDPELKNVGSTQLVNLSVATTRNFKNKEDKWEQQTSWHTVTFWGKQAEAVAKNIRKGDMVTIEGELNYSNYEDKSGNKVYKTEIRANHFYFKSSSPKAEQNSGGEPSQGDNNLPF